MTAALNWDYTALAANYELRPDYSSELIHSTLVSLNPPRDRIWLDVGAGTGKLTRLLSPAASQIFAIEPNRAMRMRGQHNTAGRAVHWIAARGEQLPLPDASAGLIAFGSSYNVLNPECAHRESLRLLGDGGIWMALWNHRDLDDPLQKQIESQIESVLPDFDRGRRRENPLPELLDRGGFRDAGQTQHRFVRKLKVTEWLAAWRSHATLQRQAGPNWESIQQAIARTANACSQSSDSPGWLQVPYVTRLYWARRT